MIDTITLATELNAFHIGQKRQIKELMNFSIKNSRSDTLMWLGDSKLDLFEQDLKGTLIVSDNFNGTANDNECTFLVVKNPRRAFQFVINKYFALKEKIGQEPSAIVAKSSKIGFNSYIGHNVVIDDDVIIGNNTVIMHNTVILRGVRIGNSCRVGSNCTIGGVGFGYEKNEHGEYELINHIGNVILLDYVEIGNNTCIDRAVLGSTIMRENVKVDNLVHIAHGCDIGKNSLVIANAMVAGSVKIGENVWVAPSSSILNQKEVSSNSIIGMGAVVLKNVPEGDIVVGNPSKSIKKP